MRTQGAKHHHSAMVPLSLLLLVLLLVKESFSHCECGFGTPFDSNSSVTVFTGKDEYYPWSVDIQGKPNKVNVLGECGGAIISETAVVSDESCFDYNETVTVFATHNTEKTVLNLGKGVVTKTASDYLVIKMESEISFNSSVSPICLSSDLNITLGLSAITTYIGDKDSTVRSQMTLLDPKDERCKKLNVPVEHKICAEIKDSSAFCDEGFGQPLTVYVDGAWFLIGVNYEHPKDCKANDTASLFTNIGNPFDKLEENKLGTGKACEPVTTTTSTTEETTTSTTEETTTSTTEETTTSTTEETTTADPQCDLNCFFESYLPSLQNMTFELKCERSNCKFVTENIGSLCSTIQMVSDMVKNSTTTA